MRFGNLGIGIALALSAASALIYEIVATNVLFFYFVESTYSLATVLSIFLFGLGVGSLFVYFILPHIDNKKYLFAYLQIFVALYAFFVLTNIAKIVDNLSTLGTFFTSFMVLFVPTVFLGAVFPLAGAIFKKKDKEVIGLVYSSDLFGAIIGSLLAGFLLIPLWGAKATIIFAACLNIISAFIMFSKKYKLIPVVLVFFLFFISLVSSGFVVEDTSEFQFYSPSPYGSIIVKDNTLYIDEREQCSINYGEDASERLMVNYALDPLKQCGLEVLNIGLGCGLTLKRALEYGAYVDVVEINPKVVLANKVMTNVLHNENVNLIINDGLSYLRKSDKKYSSILIDIENPAIAHASNIYTVEAFELVNDALVEGGTFALWNYDVFDEEEYLDIIYYSLKEVFDFVYKYKGVFVATNIDLGDKEEYVPKTSYKINTLDKKILQEFI